MVKLNIPVSESALPLELPEVESFKPANDGSSSLARNESWKNVLLNGKKYERETNTMPQWAGSCWYFLRFLDPNNSKSFAEKNKIDYWMPVDVYSLNTLYYIFFTQDFGTRCYTI